MASRFHQTIWREIQVDHPADWEVCVASGEDDPGRLMLSDRYFHRLDIRWKLVRYVPNLDLALLKHKQGRGPKEEQVQITELKTAPPPWKGLVRKTSAGSVVHAGRFFASQRLLVEAAIVWPRSRDSAAESAILDSIQPAETRAGRRWWQALGLSVQAPIEARLAESDMKPGQIRWVFDYPESKSRLCVRVERLAMPGRLLSGRSLHEWLHEELGEDPQVLRHRRLNVGPHSAEEFVTIGETPVGLRLRGLRKLCLDRAWECQKEKRIYRLSISQPRLDEEIALPEGFDVRCCQEIPVPKTQGTVV